MMTSMNISGQIGSIEKTYRIGELAQEFEITLRTLRFYEDKGLLNPRRVGATRLYSRSDRARLKIILLGKRVGMSLQDIHEILDLYNPDGSNEKQIAVSIEKGEKQMEVLKEERAKVDSSIAELESTLKKLRELPRT